MVGAVARVLSLLLVLELSGGCSFIFVRRPPADYKLLPSFECTSSKAAPTVDTVFAVTSALGLSSFNDPSQRNWTTAAVAGAWTALFIGAAFYGYETTASCRAAKVELSERQRLGRVAPTIGRPIGDDHEMPSSN
jgi:hypothetical protein